MTFPTTIEEIEASKKERLKGMYVDDDGWVVYTVRHKDDNCYFIATTRHLRMWKIRKSHHTSKRQGSENPFHKALRTNHQSKFEWKFLQEFKDRKSANEYKNKLIKKLREEASVYNVLRKSNR